MQGQGLPPLSPLGQQAEKLSFIFLFFFRHPELQPASAWQESRTVSTRPRHVLGPHRRDFFYRVPFFFSRANRSAVRFFAAAVAAFFALADRSSGVMVSKLRLPPILPPLRPISRMISEKIAFVFLSTIPS
jgi:hypothetical protein